MAEERSHVLTDDLRGNGNGQRRYRHAHTLKPNEEVDHRVELQSVKAVLNQHGIANPETLDELTTALNHESNLRPISRWENQRTKQRIGDVIAGRAEHSGIRAIKKQQKGIDNMRSALDLTPDTEKVFDEVEDDLAEQMAALKIRSRVGSPSGRAAGQASVGMEAPKSGLGSRSGFNEEEVRARFQPIARAGAGAGTFAAAELAAGGVAGGAVGAFVGGMVGTGIAQNNDCDGQGQRVGHHSGQMVGAGTGGAIGGAATAAFLGAECGVFAGPPGVVMGAAAGVATLGVYRGCVVIHEQLTDDREQFGGFLSYPTCQGKLPSDPDRECGKWILNRGCRHCQKKLCLTCYAQHFCTHIPQRSFD